MSKEKQIEELAGALKFCKDTSIDECHTKKDCHHCISEQIYNAGYRKQSDGVWKFNKGGSGTCSECGMTQKNVWDYDGFQRFCGCCGAKMKGELYG